MMGPYAYYDTSFIDDIPAELHYHHDCMWSGECCSSQTNRLTFSNAPVVPGANGTVPITVGGNGYITLTTTTTTHLDTNSKSIVSVTLNEQKVPTKLAEKCHEKLFDEESSESSTISTPEIRPKPKLKAKKTARSNSRKSSSNKHSSSSDNKKLRHREVEKNRHRQLQAMVKTLSEKIPGRLDKETQVQTMKRAARYCIYLRDSLTLVSSGQSVMVKEKLEKNYLRSCDNVEQMMSQHMSAR